MMVGLYPYIHTHTHTYMHIWEVAGRGGRGDLMCFAKSLMPIAAECFIRHVQVEEFWLPHNTAISVEFICAVRQAHQVPFVALILRAIRPRNALDTN